MVGKRKGKNKKSNFVFPVKENLYPLLLKQLKASTRNDVISAFAVCYSHLTEVFVPL